MSVWIGHRTAVRTATDNKNMPLALRVLLLDAASFTTRKRKAANRTG
jgi:hypothetical protein